MFGNRHYNQHVRRYTAVFGTLFNDIKIQRKDSANTVIQDFKVPLAYGPKQKFLSKLDQDPAFGAQAIILPRMAFNMTGMSYNGERAVGRTQKHSVAIESDDGVRKLAYTPAPYDLEFELSIMTKFEEDGAKILEQIIPYFRPDWTPSIKLVDELDYYLDVPIVLTGVSPSDEYEGDYEQRRALVWDLTFTMKAWFFGPSVNKKVIKFAEVKTYSDIASNSADTRITVQPGLTANGNPTIDITETIPFDDINEYDNWDFIVQIEDYNE